MQRPKFQFGDIVESEFNGFIEGVPVTVKKRLFVQGLAGNVSASRLSFTYNVCENDPEKHSELGRTYQMQEYQLMELEPLIQEMERTNRKFVAPAINQIDQMQSLQKIFQDAQKASQAVNPYSAPWSTISSGSTGQGPDYTASQPWSSDPHVSRAINALSSIAGSGNSHTSAGALPGPEHTNPSEQA